MKVRNIKIEIKSDDELRKELKETWKRIERGKEVKKHEGLYFENLETMRKVLTEERLRILRQVKKNHPSSIYELAKLLGRDIKNTFDDVQFLSQVGLLQLKKTKDGREKTTPIVSYDKILLEIPV
jgi:predicted transcriptional regulator